MGNVYAPPQASVEQEDKNAAILRRLAKEQSAVGVVLGTLFGLMPATVLLAILSDQGRLPIILLVVPGFVVGYFVKFCGRPFARYWRLFPAFITTLVVGALFWLLSMNPLIYLLAPVNGLVAGVLCRRSLTRDEEKALFALRLGKVSL